MTKVPRLARLLSGRQVLRLGQELTVSQAALDKERNALAAARQRVGELDSEVGPLDHILFMVVS